MSFRTLIDWMGIIILTPLPSLPQLPKYSVGRYHASTLFLLCKKFAIKMVLRLLVRTYNQAEMLRWVNMRNSLGSVRPKSIFKLLSVNHWLDPKSQGRGASTRLDLGANFSHLQWINCHYAQGTLNVFLFSGVSSIFADVFQCILKKTSARKAATYTATSQKLLFSMAQPFSILFHFYHAKTWIRRRLVWKLAQSKRCMSKISKYFPKSCFVVNNETNDFPRWHFLALFLEGRAIVARDAASNGHVGNTGEPRLCSLLPCFWMSCSVPKGNKIHQNQHAHHVGSVKNPVYACKQHFQQ